MTFEQAYIEYFARMQRFAESYIASSYDAENIVQDIFTMLWERKIDLTAQPNLTSYLLTILKHRCLDHLKHKKIMEQHEVETALHIRALEESNYEYETDTEISETIQRCIEKLPLKCKEIFLKSKIEGKKNKEIALELNISVNTVEGQMTIALKRLRQGLKGELFTILLLFENILK